MKRINLNYTGTKVNITDIIRLTDDTFVIVAKNGKYYVNHETFEVHNEYPLTRENLVTDKDFMDHINFRIDGYVSQTEESLKQNKELLVNLIGPETDEQLLERNGWCIICESPFEISHDNGSFVSGDAIQTIIAELKKQKDYENNW